MKDDTEKPIYAALGELAINWNFAENWIRNLAGIYAGKVVVGEILTVELGSVGLQNVLCAIAKHSPLGDEASHLRHCAELYERLRGYRNYYIHGTIFVIGTQGRLKKPTGFTFTKSAKGQIKVYSAEVEAPQIQAVADQCYDLGLFARGVWSHFRGGPTGGGGLPSLPDKPPLPPVLDKSAPYPQSPPSEG